jgi:uncharacterized protein (TIGR02594 family)
VVSQSLEEEVSEVVYKITEPEAPPSRSDDLFFNQRPKSRPEDLIIPISQPYTPRQLKDQIKINSQNILIAEMYLGFTESKNRYELKEFMNIDPRIIEWCAAFVNSVLNENDIPGSATVSIHPLLARSFLEWGDPVDHKNKDPMPGDVVIFPRGRASWQGHVGFYVETVNIDGKEYWRILGGNQKNSVSIELYDPKRALAVRRHQYTEIASEQGLIRILRNVFQNI